MDETFIQDRSGAGTITSVPHESPRHDDQIRGGVERAIAHDSDTGQGDRNEKGKQKCLSASGNKKCVCHKKTTGVDICEIDD